MMRSSRNRNRVENSDNVVSGGHANFLKMYAKHKHEILEMSKKFTSEGKEKRRGDGQYDEKNSESTIEMIDYPCIPKTASKQNQWPIPECPPFRSRQPSNWNLRTVSGGTSSSPKRKSHKKRRKHHKKEEKCKVAPVEAPASLNLEVPQEKFRSISPIILTPRREISCMPHVESPEPEGELGLIRPKEQRQFKFRSISPIIRSPERKLGRLDYITTPQSSSTVGKKRLPSVEITPHDEALGANVNTNPEIDADIDSVVEDHDVFVDAEVDDDYKIQPLRIDPQLLQVPTLKMGEHMPHSRMESISPSIIGSLPSDTPMNSSRMEGSLTPDISIISSRMGGALSPDITILNGGGGSRKSSVGNLSIMMKERTISWKTTMQKRTSIMKEHIKRPPSPDNISIASTKEDEGKPGRRMSLTSFIGVVPSSMSFASSADKGLLAGGVKETKLQRCKKLLMRPPWKWNILPRSIDRQSKKYLVWLAIVAVCFLYNAFTPPLRTSFPYQTDSNWMYWLFFDILTDLINLFDMIIMKPRLRFMKAGLTIKSPTEMRRRYLMGKMFKFDLIAILPTDFLYFKFGYQPMIRINRVFKILSYWEFFQNVDSLVQNPTVLRIGRILSYIVYMIHCNCCIFYSLSAWEGFENARYYDSERREWRRNPWVYNNQGNAYLRCFYFTTKVATSIGNNPAPKNVIEFCYMLISWMSGVFVFALLLGQIRDIIATSQKNRDEFRKKMDGVLQYCKALKIPDELQDRVREWFIHTWRTQKTLDENALIRQLPHKLQTDLAISVHYQTLSKVQLFTDCDKALLRDLVLKLKPVLYLPGDYICKKGEVGKEMYIVTKGILEVVGGPDGKTVFATLNEGSSFGEISLLALAGGNRRTANVISKGFSNLFVLSKDDLNETIRDYPDAQRVLRKKAEKLINKDAAAPKKEKQDELEKLSSVSTHVQTPRMMTTIAQLIKPTSETGKKLHQVLEKEASASNSSDSEDEKTVLYGMNIKQLLGVVQQGTSSATGEQSEARADKSEIKPNFLAVPTEPIASRPESMNSIGSALNTLPPERAYLIDTSDSD